MDSPRHQIRRILGEARSPISAVVSSAGSPEITFNAYDESGDAVGDVEIYLAEAPDGWYIAVLLVLDGEPRLVVRDERIGDTRDDAIEAAVLRANDAVNELGYTADL